MKVAAILLIPLMLAGEHSFTVMYLTVQQLIQKREHSAAILPPWDRGFTFSLPDGTKGMLNSGSRLDYSVPFTSDRKVKLEERPG
jgi:hypothetical protein